MPNPATESVAGASRAPRSARLGVRATPEQELVLRRAAEIAQKSLTEFILDSACRAAEETLLDQRLFVVSGERCQRLLDLLERPAADNAGLRDLFARPDPWAPASPGQAPLRQDDRRVAEHRGGFEPTTPEHETREPE